MSEIPKSIRQCAFDAIIAALKSDGTPAKQAYLVQLDQIPQENLPCYEVVPEEEAVATGEFGDHGSVTRTLKVTVRSLVDATDVGVAALDPLYVFAVQQLMGNGADLGAVVLEVKEIGGPFVYKPEDRDIMGYGQAFEIQFATARDNPAQKG